MTRSRRSNKPAFRCVACGEAIEAGQERYEWEFRYGGPHRQHVTCGYPKRSQLTQSLLGEVYGTIEGIEEHGWGGSVEEIVTNISAVKESAEEIKGQYEDAAENFGGQGPSAEKAEELDSFISELESAESEVENAEKADDEDDDEYLERLQQIAADAVGNCP